MGLNSHITTVQFVHSIPLCQTHLPLLCRQLIQRKDCTVQPRIYEHDRCKLNSVSLSRTCLYRYRLSGDLPHIRHNGCRTPQAPIHTQRHRRLSPRYRPPSPHTSRMAVHTAPLAPAGRVNLPHRQAAMHPFSPGSPSAPLTRLVTHSCPHHSRDS